MLNVIFMSGRITVGACDPAKYTKETEGKVAKRTSELADKIKELESVNKSMVGRELKMVELKKRS